MMNLISFPEGKISHTILQYSKQASAAHVHKDFDKGGTGVKVPGPCVLDLLKTSSSIGESEGKDMIGPWSKTKTVFRLLGHAILEFYTNQNKMRDRLNATYSSHR